MENRLISYLYDEGEISGETYLYCIENDIESIDDVRLNDVPEDRACIYKELQALRISIAGNENDLPLDNSKDNLKDGFKNININVSESLVKQDEEEGVYRIIYEEALKKVDTRAKNVLNGIKSRCFTDEEFYEFILDFKDEVTHPKVRNAGRKTILQILNIADELRKAKGITLKSEDTNVQNHEVALIINLDSIWPMISSEIKKLSVRSQNAFNTLLKGCHNSLNELYIKISDSKFSIGDIKNVGEKSIPELTNFFQYIKEIASKVNDETEESRNELIEKQKFVSDNILSVSNIDIIFSEKRRLGHLPIFEIIQMYLNSLSARDKIILEGQINIYVGQVLKSRDELITMLDLTGERIRQIKFSIFDNLESRIKYISSKEYIDLSYYDNNTIKFVNSNEYTKFKNNFLLWVLSIISNNYYILGNAKETLLNPDNKRLNLNIVPDELNQIFDFQLFLQNFNEVYNDKHNQDYKLNLNGYILDFFRGNIQYEYFEKIEKACRYILARCYDCLFDGNYIIIEANSYRNIPDIVEDIIRDHGSAMSKDEIYEVFVKKYPDRNVTISSIAASININTNLSAIGRTSTYTLKEWNKGYKRGGTIREFALEYIMQTTKHIASVNDLVKYIKKYRPSTSEKSIVSNLQAEANKLFSVYIKDGVRYIGITKEEYNSCYERLSEDIERRDFKTSIDLLIAFILKNNRFPYNYSTADDSEVRLNRFWNAQKKKKEKGTLSEKEKELFDLIIDQYGDLDISYADYMWRNRYNELTEYLREKGNRYLPEHLKRWYYKNNTIFNNGELKDWQEELFINIIYLWNNA